MSEDMEYTITTRPMPPAIPLEEIRLLAGTVDQLTFHQSRAARLVLDWLARMEDDAENETDGAG